LHNAKIDVLVNSKKMQQISINKFRIFPIKLACLFPSTFARGKARPLEVIDFVAPVGTQRTSRFLSLFLLPSYCQAAVPS
jgi:hypothetical protein